ncbi:CapA family protein [Paenibacillus sp. NPDC056579]|uniref:CapA family protein n=1 Tax=unclassified Paenibacillus TaxID=185978 RepID=UPI001EF7E562|nr:CapA family protein [Paenibacillus sp. H1-7]ULL14373.1 CapA family protein [Paenibacillus sp. H1-7]
MSTEITIAAVGDFLIKTRIIRSAKVSGDKNFSFDEIFEPVAPYLREADLTIGNLETTFSGPGIGDYLVPRRNPKTKWPLFNCPDQFAGTLKNLGFDVLSTANNHCVDCGISGLKRTLKVLDAKGIAHTGTYRSYNESRELLIKNVKGIKIGFLAYTKGTNRMPVPSDHSWAVNLIDTNKMIADLKRLKARNVDLIIVCMHFGREYRKLPIDEQRNWVRILFKYGADIVLGAHSHVIQPAIMQEVKDHTGVTRRRFAIYSLGNFISTRLYRNDHTLTGLITRIKVRKHDDGRIEIMNTDFIPTWVKSVKNGFRVVPLGKAVEKKIGSSSGETERMKAMYQHVKRHITKYSDPPEFKMI